MIKVFLKQSRAIKQIKGWKSDAQHWHHNISPSNRILLVQYSSYLRSVLTSTSRSLLWPVSMRFLMNKIFTDRWIHILTKDSFLQLDLISLFLSERCGIPAYGHFLTKISEMKGRELRYMISSLLNSLWRNSYKSDCLYYRRQKYFKSWWAKRRSTTTKKTSNSWASTGRV
jgi:hypothetical protein